MWNIPPDLLWVSVSLFAAVIVVVGAGIWYANKVGSENQDH